MSPAIPGTISSVVDENHLPDIIKSIRSLEGYEVEAGVFGPESGMTVGSTPITMEQLAVILHEGCRIPVTDKMRAFLASLGLYVRADTKYIHIPARPFLDPILNQIEEYVWETVVECVDVAIDQTAGDIGSSAFSRIGRQVVEMIRQETIELQDPENHIWTVWLKGFDNPLVDSSRFQEAIHHEVRRK